MIIEGIYLKISGEVYITSNNIEGVAVWHPHGIKDFKLSRQSKEIVRELRKVKREVFSEERYHVTSEITNSYHNEHTNFPHWELIMITVDPLH